jgi:hypothetical protein
MLFTGRPQVLQEGAVLGGSLLSCSHAGYNLRGGSIRYTCFRPYNCFKSCFALFCTVVKLRGVSQNILYVGHVHGHVLD